MARTHTIASIKDAIRNETDMQYSKFIKDAELLGYINASYADLHDLLSSKFEDYFLDFATFSLVPGTDIYQLPGNFYKLTGVDLKVNSTEAITLKPFLFAERNNKQPALRYRVAGQTLVFAPSVSMSNEVTVWYTPAATTFTADSQLLDGINGWEEYVIVDCAIKCLAKEESDVSVMMARKAEIKQRIEIMAADRDAGAPARIVDVKGGSDEDNTYFYGV